MRSYYTKKHHDQKIQWPKSQHAILFSISIAYRITASPGARGPQQPVPSLCILYPVAVSHKSLAMSKA